MCNLEETQTLLVEEHNTSYKEQKAVMQMKSLGQFQTFLFFFLQKDFTITKTHKNAHKRTKIKKGSVFMPIKNI